MHVLDTNLIQAIVVFVMRCEALCTPSQVLYGAERPRGREGFAALPLRVQGDPEGEGDRFRTAAEGAPEGEAQQAF